MEEKKIPIMDGYGLSHVEIKDAINGCAQIYLDGQLVKGAMGYKIEQDAAKNRVPLLTLQVNCDLTLDCGAIPVLSEPWTWFYEPKVPNFTDVRDILSGTE